MGDWDVKKETGTEGWGVKKETDKGNIALPGWLKEMSDQQSQPGFERDIYPIAGDIAGSFIPSPFGKMKGAKAGIKALNLLFKSGAAATGAATGEYGAQKIYGEETDFGEMGEQALWGATGEGGTRVVGAMLKPVLKWASEFTVLGSGVKEWWRKKLIDRTTNRAKEFIEEFAPEIAKSGGKVTDINDLSRLVQEGVDEYKAAYEIFNEHIDTLARGREGGVLLDDTQELLGGLRDKWLEGGKEKISKYIQETYGYAPGSKQSVFLEKTIVDEVANPDNLKDFLASIYSKGKKNDWGDILPTQRTARENLKKAVVEDISKASPEAAAAKESADKVFGEIANFRKIEKIFSKGGAIRKAPSGDWFLNPTKLSDNIQQNKKVINKIDPSGALWKRMSEDAQFYRKMAANWRPPTKSKTEVILGGLGRGGMGAAAVGTTLGPEWIPVAEGFGLFSTWMHLSKKSRDILGGIVKNVIVKPAAHIGGPMALPLF